MVAVLNAATLLRGRLADRLGWRPGKAEALADVQAAAVTTDLAEITTALRNTA